MIVLVTGSHFMPMLICVMFYYANVFRAHEV